MIMINIDKLGWLVKMAPELERLYKAHLNNEKISMHPTTGEALMDMGIIKDQDLSEMREVK
jgi:hypothetical protein